MRHKNVVYSAYEKVIHYYNSEALNSYGEPIGARNIARKRIIAEVEKAIDYQYGKKTIDIIISTIEANKGGYRNVF